MPVDLGADHRVHTAFSSGTASVAEMVTAAETAGLRRLVVADHADAGTRWLSAYLAAVGRAAARTAVSVHAGVTVRMADTTGVLDLPLSLSGLEYIVITTDGLALPPARRRVTDLPGNSPASPDTGVDPLEILVTAICRGLAQAAMWGQPILADPFAPLRHLRLTETGLRSDLLHALADACRDTGAAVEVNERLRRPSVAAVRVLAGVGVPLLPASAAHHRCEVGRWEYVRNVAEATAPRDVAEV